MASDDEIRELRRNGELLGPLVDRFGADAVVRALGVMHIADALGITERARYRGRIWEDGDDGESEGS